MSSLLSVFLFAASALAEAPTTFHASSLDAVLTLASAECDVWSENGSCRGAAFGADCINDHHVTGSCVPAGSPNWSGNYRCVCQ